ncbi:MAG: hypothetical protein VW397_00295 [Candidatus Margulisiibacteriota bacterium]
MNRHLLGFYCEGHLPVSISGDTPFFKDKSQSARMVATIVPIKCIQTQSEWLMIPNMFDVPQSLQSVFDQQLILTTATDEDSKTNHVRYAVLMHALENAPEMARTGVLLHRVRDSWEPMVVKFRDVPYLVECKGVGSPLGGYVSFHQRTQAGTSKTHTRVTGGLLQESMSAEFENLMRVQSYHQFTVPGILPLACIGFEFITNENTLNMGLLLRLTRSNIRYSYEDFGSFSDDKPNVYAMFSQQNQLLFSAGLRHQNLTANNLVYHDSSHYVVTDYEELTPIYKAPTSLDSDASSVPLFLKIYPFRFLYQSLYTTPEANVFFDPTIANQEIDQQFIQSQPILKDYVSATRSCFFQG